MKHIKKIVFGMFAVLVFGVIFTPAVFASQGSGESGDDSISRTEGEVRGSDRSVDDNPSPGEDRLRTRTEDRSMDDSVSTGTDDNTQTRTQTRTRGEDDLDDSTSTDDDSDDSSGGRGDEHRSEVARFVRVLLDAADRDEGLGEDVRTIAREQASSSEKVVKALGEVEDRGKVRTFFFGPDYKNLGAIRSEMVQTKSRIERLNREVGKVSSSTDAVAIQAEIQRIEQERTRLEQYVKDHESTFSLFGWAVRFFED